MYVCNNMSSIAKNGYYEEIFVVNELNNNIELRKRFEIFCNGNFNCLFYKEKGNTKIDINGPVSIQNKKYKLNQFQQIDRHWYNNLLNFIPSLQCYKYIFQNLCENSYEKRKINEINYTEQTINMFLKCMNENILDILNFALYGIDESKPEFLTCVEYKNNSRHSLTIMKYSHIIEFLSKQKFHINNSKTVISLGNNYISLQKKGGDKGALTANQLAFKIKISSIIPHINNKLIHFF